MTWARPLPRSSAVFAGRPVGAGRQESIALVGAILRTSFASQVQDLIITPYPGLGSSKLFVGLFRRPNGALSVLPAATEATPPRLTTAAAGGCCLVTLNIRAVAVPHFRTLHRAAVLTDSFLFEIRVGGRMIALTPVLMRL